MEKKVINIRTFRGIGKNWRIKFNKKGENLILFIKTRKITKKNLI